MPWKSKQQARWGHSPAGEAALGGKGKVAEWDKATTKPLPERIGKTPMQKSEAKLARAMKGHKR